jgi:hypothetical protein
MNNLLKITTKPIKIAVKVEKGHYIETQAPKLKANRIRQSPPIQKLEPSHEVPSYNPQNTSHKAPEQNIQNHLNERMESNELDVVPYMDAQSSQMRLEPKQVMKERILTYHPSELEFEVQQYTEIRFDYQGDPIYVPASSNPELKK